MHNNKQISRQQLASCCSCTQLQYLLLRSNFVRTIPPPAACTVSAMSASDPYYLVREEIQESVRTAKAPALRNARATDAQLAAGEQSAVWL